MKNLIFLLKKIVVLIMFVSISILVSCDIDTIDKNANVYVVATNDMHCAYENDEKNNTIGFEYIAGGIEILVENNSNYILVDAGDAIQGDTMEMKAKSDYILKLIDELKYDVLIPGEHEFDFGMEKFMEITTNRPYICCNFMKEGEAVLPRYKIIDFERGKIGFVGVTTPHTIMSSTPEFFQNEEGKTIYSFCEENLYKVVQNTVDEVRKNGADKVVLIAHLGNSKDSEPYTSKDLIKNTTGINAVIDGHSHQVVENEYYRNKENKRVILTQAGYKQSNISLLTFYDDNSIEARFILKEELHMSDRIKAIIDEINKELKNKS